MRARATAVRARSAAVDLGYAAGWRIVRALPERVATTLFDRGADWATRRQGKGIRQLKANLGRVVGSQTPPDELDELTRAAMRSYARYWMETFRLPSMDKGAILAHVEAIGAEHIDTAATGGRGFILALPHSGNWDVAGIWLLHRGYPFTTVAERLKPESLYDRFVAYREALGMEIIPLTGGPRSPVEVLGERLRAGRAVCLMADRDLSARGVTVNFFGSTARFPPGPALLAATTGAPLLPVVLAYRSDGWILWIGDPVDLGEGRLRDRVQRGTQALADAFAARLVEYPTDWHMLQPLWEADLTPRSASVQAAPPRTDP